MSISATLGLTYLQPSASCSETPESQSPSLAGTSETEDRERHQPGWTAAPTLVLLDSTPRTPSPACANPHPFRGYPNHSCSGEAPEEWDVGQQQAAWGGTAGMGTAGLLGQTLSKDKLIPFSGSSLQREDDGCRPRVPQKAGFLLLAVKFLTRMPEGTGSAQSIPVKKEGPHFVCGHLLQLPAKGMQNLQGMGQPWGVKQRRAAGS